DRGGIGLVGSAGCEKIPAPTSVAAIPATTATSTTTLRLKPAIIGVVGRVAAGACGGSGVGCWGSASGRRGLPHRHVSKPLGTFRAHFGQVQTNWSAIFSKWSGGAIHCHVTREAAQGGHRSARNGTNVPHDLT